MDDHDTERMSKCGICNTTDGLLFMVRTYSQDGGGLLETRTIVVAACGEHAEDVQAGVDLQIVDEIGECHADDWHSLDTVQQAFALLDATRDELCAIGTVISIEGAWSS